MLSIHEQDQLRKLVEMIGNEEVKNSPLVLDVSQRLRDEKGRFLPNEFPLDQTEKPSPGRSIKIVKVKGSYGTYVVKDRWLSDTDRNIMYTAMGIIVMAIIF